MGNRVKVTVPGPDFRMGPNETKYWHYLGSMIRIGVDLFGLDMTLSIVLSRLSRELRRHIGTEAAREVFTECARTMDAASENDR